jgi:hypothetical protein
MGWKQQEKRQSEGEIWRKFGGRDLGASHVVQYSILYPEMIGTFCNEPDPKSNVAFSF